MIRNISRAALKSRSALPTRAFSTNIQDSPFGGLPAPPTTLLSEFATTRWEEFGSKTAIIEGVSGESRTFSQYSSRTASVAGSLASSNDVTASSSHRTTVTVFSPNHIDYAPCVLGVLRSGGVVSTANPLYTEYELRGQIEKSNSTILVCHPSTLEVGLKSIEGTKISKVIVFGSDDMGKSVIPFDSLAETDNLMMSPPTYVTDTVGVNDLAMLPFSSGTTGLPKGTMLSHNNISINLQQFVAPEGDYMKDNTTIISPLPLFHIYGFTAGMLHSSWMANTLVTMAAFDLVKFCELVQEHKPERAHLVPPIILGLAKHPIVDNYDFSSLDMVVSAAAPLGAEVQMAVRDRLNIGVKQAWGMSELSPIGTVTPDNKLKEGQATIGPVVAGTQGKIVDLETGEALPPGEENTGELCIKGPQVMLGYLDEPEKTRECLTEDGWLHSGDIGYVDEDGYYYIVDRLKELIKYKGFQVAPAELEAVICSNDLLTDCAVIPVEDKRGGEVPRAYVVKREGVEVSEEDVLAYVEERVAPHKKLRGGVVFIDAIPKNPSGKILRRVVIEMDRAGGA